MKKTIVFTLLVLVSATVHAQKFENTEKARSYFYTLNDSFNVVSTQDSVFFAAYFTDEFINETPYGTLNNKQEKINDLIGLAPSHVERVATQFDIFTLPIIIKSMKTLFLIICITCALKTFSQNNRFNMHHIEMGLFI